MPTADELLNAATVARLAGCLRGADGRRRWPALEASPAGFSEQALAERVRAVQAALLADLPDDYGATARLVRRALGGEGLDGWMTWPLGEAVAARALASAREADFEDGLELLAELTGRLTSEYAIRGFLAADLDRALRTVQGWTDHPDEHVRRLASEGTRPRLPWARRVPELITRPGVTLPVLDALHRDDSEYVRRSVGNHLNDLSRLDPALAVGAARGWLREDEVESVRLAKRAMRTLVKAGDPEALALFGFAPPREVLVEGLRLDQATVAIGGQLGFAATVTNGGSEACELAIDYVVGHRRANGQLSPKVFKLTTRRLAPGERVELSRRHSFKPITTRRYYPGPHTIELQVNGVRFGQAGFELVQ
jgi:3-methyladenine DNA glycosylase AlkC